MNRCRYIYMLVPLWLAVTSCMHAPATGGPEIELPDPPTLKALGEANHLCVLITSESDEDQLTELFLARLLERTERSLTVSRVRTDGGRSTPYDPFSRFRSDRCEFMIALDLLYDRWGGNMAVGTVVPYAGIPPGEPGERFLVWSDNGGSTRAIVKRFADDLAPLIRGAS